MLVVVDIFPIKATITCLLCVNCVSISFGSEKCGLRCVVYWGFYIYDVHYQDKPRRLIGGCVVSSQLLSLVRNEFLANEKL